MTSEVDYGREPFVLVELVQPRCGLRFGTSPCTATGTPKCYQTWASCKDRANIDMTGSITWRFVKPNAGILPLYAETGDDIETNPIPLLVSVSTASAEINIGAQREGQSPLGIRAKCTVTLQDAPWDDHVGDFYLADRSGVRGAFWAKWRARNAFYGGMMIRIYEGYRGQALGAMQRRDYILETVTGPDAGGRVTLEGSDPLRLAQLKDAQFPRSTDIRLVSAIDASTAAVTVTVVDPADLSDAFGNTALRYLRVNSEIIAYSGQTVVSGNVYTLDGVRRGQLGTDAAAQSADATAQRVGRYEASRGWEVAADLIDAHTRIPAGYRDAAQWADEGLNYLLTQRADRTIPAPQSVESLLGELCQQFGFSIWWDERLQKIPLLPNRAPRETPTEISDTLDILAGSPTIDDDQDAQISRVAVYYAPRSPLDFGKPENYRNLWLTIDGEIEAPAAADAVRTLTIYANWITRDGDAMRLAARLLLRFRLIPRYMSFAVDAKNRSLKLGDVLSVTTGAWVDVEGNPLQARWQVIKAEEVEAGHTLSLRLQSYAFIGRFGFIMAASAADYDVATDEEKATGCYMADALTGLMPNGDEPYLIQ